MTDTLRKSREQASPAKYGIDMLYKHCEEANKLRWVIASGRPYFVNRRENSDGTFTHFVDRSA